MYNFYHIGSGPVKILLINQAIKSASKHAILKIATTKRFPNLTITVIQDLSMGSREIKDFVAKQSRAFCCVIFVSSDVDQVSLTGNQDFIPGTFGTYSKKSDFEFDNWYTQHYELPVLRIPYNTETKYILDFMFMYANGK